MRFSANRLCVLGLCVLAAMTQAAEPVPLENALPDDTLAALAIPSPAATRAAYAQTRMAQIYAQPEIQECAQPVFAEIERQYLAVRAEHPQLPPVETITGVLLSSSVVVAVAPSHAKGTSVADLLLIVKPDDAVAFAKSLPPELAASAQTKKTADYSPFHALWTGEYLALSSSPLALQLMADRLNNPAQAANTLAGSAVWKDARAHLSNSVAWMLLQPKKALALTSVPAQYRSDFMAAKTVCGALGLDTVDSLAIGAGFRGAETVVEGWAGLSQGPATGVLALFAPSQDPLDVEALKIVPQAAPYVAVGDFNWSALLPLAAHVVGVLEPAAGQQFSAQLQMLNQNVLHFDLQKDLLENIGSKCVLVQPSRDNGPLGIPSLAASFSLKNPARLKDCVSKFAALLDGLPEPLKGKLKLKQVTRQGQSIRYVSAPVLPLSPAFCVVGNRLLLGTTLGSVDQALAQLTRTENILSNKSFQETLARVTGKPFDEKALPAAFCFAQESDEETGSLTLLGAGAGLAACTTAGLANLPGPDGVPAPPLRSVEVVQSVMRETDLGLWPDEQFFGKYRHPAASFTATEKNGIYWRTELPIPAPALPTARMAALPVIGVVAIGAGMTLPVLARARESARRTASASNLNQMGKAAFMFSDVPANKEMFPEDAAQLYPNFVADAKVFQNPRFPQSETPYTWVGGCSPDMADAVLAFETDESGGGRNVLFTMGMVEWLNEGEFQKRLAGTAQQIKKAKREMKLTPVNWRALLAGPRVPQGRLRRAEPAKPQAEEF